MPEWTHFDENGNARMVDVTEKNPTIRTATAVGSLLVSEEVLSAIKGHEIKKGDVLTVAQVAGIMAVKQTSHLIPMCHPLLTQNCTVNFALEEKPSPRVIARCTVKLEGRQEWRWKRSPVSRLLSPRFMTCARPETDGHDRCPSGREDRRKKSGEFHF